MKSLFLFLISLTCAQFLRAQPASQPKKFHWGVFGGAQIIGKTFTYESLEKTRGALFGADAGYTFGSKRSGLSVHAQPNWSFYNRTNKAWGISDSYRIQAVNLPLLLRYTLTSGKIRPFAEAGPNFRYRTAFKIVNNGFSCIVCKGNGREYTNDIQSRTTQNLIGMVAGVGVEVEAGKIIIPLTLRLNEGLGTYRMKNILEDDVYYKDLKTRNIQIVAAITF